MYTLLDIRKKVTVLCDKMPRGGSRRLDEKIGEYPPAYKNLYTHIRGLQVPTNSESSFELFPLLDIQTQMRLQGMQYPKRINEYQKLISLIHDWSGYACTIMHGELRDGVHYTIEGGPIVTLKGEEVPFGQIAKERVSASIQRLLDLARGS